MDKLKGSIPVPCGKCPNCLARRVSSWSFRIMQETKRSLSAHFITLTYDTSHVPITPAGFMEIRKRDLQLFFKRLRKASPKCVAIKYYAVGEYGGNTKRPHYHIILFNAQLPLIQPAWSLGQVNYGDERGVTMAAAGYCLKYISKKWRPMHHNDDRQPPFALMSKGLGDNYLTDAMKAWHLADLDNRMYCNLLDGKKITMPRYYKEKVYSETQRKVAGAHTRYKMIQDEQKAIELAGSPETYWATRAQAHIASFRRKDHNDSKRNKI